MYVPIVSRLLIKEYRDEEDETAGLKPQAAAPFAGLSMNELLNRQKTLRSVSPSALPVHLGGKHMSYCSEESPLKKELLLKAGQIQGQLRPRMEEFRLQQEEQAKAELQAELKELFTNHGPFVKESPMRPKYALDKIVQSQPGWLEMQREIRVSAGRNLNPVVFDEFYVVRSTTLRV